MQCCSEATKTVENLYLVGAGLERRKTRKSKD